MLRFLMKAHYVLSAPFAILVIMTSGRIHPHYRMGPFRRFRLGIRMFWNSIRIQTATSYKSHLAMALQLLETPPGLLGAGTGLPLGEYFVGPFSQLSSHALWHPNGVGYTQKGMSGVWAYYPEDPAN